jgi:amidase
MTSDLCWMTATEMVSHLRSGQLSALELLEAHLAQIERVNPAVNAIVTYTPEHALEQARQADRTWARDRGAVGRLHGLPIAHKDLQPTRGIRTTLGSPIYRDWVPDYDSLTIARLGRAGVIQVGKTNVPEFGAGSHTFNRVFGATCNPYDTTRTCGGSSGGAAAALACGMIPIADGSDMGGSLRNPASFCNVVGFRPSPGRVPALPTAAQWSPFAVDGPMARTVEDAALMLSAIAGYAPGFALAIRQRGQQFARPLPGRDFRGVKVAWPSRLLGLPVQPAVRQAFERQRKVFESLGCIVEDAEPDLADAQTGFMAWRHAGFYLLVRRHIDAHGPEVLDQFKPEIRWHYEKALEMRAVELAEADAARSRAFDSFDQFMQRYRFLVLPSAQVLPFPVEQRWVEEIDGVRMGYYIEWMKVCWLISAVSAPALAVPATFQDGLPFGVQIVGRHQDDWGVLQMGHAFEQASGSVWKTRPAVVGQAG